MADNVGRAGRYWAIAGAFAGQAWIFVTLGMLFAGWALAPKAPSVSVAQPATASLLPAINPEVVPRSGVFSYTLSMGGRTAGGLFPDGEGAPTFTVLPGRDLLVQLQLKVPATVHLTGLTLGLAEIANAPVRPQDQVAFRDAGHPLTAGQPSFTVDWPGSRGKLRPGTSWRLFLYTESPGFAGPIATITVAP